MAFQAPNSSQTRDMINGGAAAPSYAPPSQARAFELSADVGALAAGAAALGGFGGLDACLCGRDAQQLYQGQRIFGSSSARRIAQGQSGSAEAGPVLQRLPDGSTTTRFVNPEPLRAVVEGRSLCGGPGDYREDASMGFGPSRQYGMTPAPVRAEHALQTVSIGLSTPKGGEMTNPRPFVPMQGVSLMNLAPVSESAAMRANNACRLNKMQAALVAMKLGASQS